MKKLDSLEGLRGFMALWALLSPPQWSSWVTVVLENRAALWLGKISYSVYCLHMIVMYVCVYAMVFWFPVRDKTTYALILIPVSLLLTLLLSWATYHSIESPLQNIGKKLSANISNRRKVGPSPGALSKTATD